MTEIQNTTDFYGRNPEVVLLAGMADGGLTDLIEGMEAQGQRQLVNSDRLPTAMTGGTQADFEALGFTFGDPDPADPLFRPATVPAGWKREASDHAMGSYLVDQHGRRRVSIFYKAAFYDRRAHMSLVSPYGYLMTWIWSVEDLGLPVLDDEWLTPEVADATLAGMRDRHLAEAAAWDRHIADTGRTEENRAACRGLQQNDRDRAAKAEALRVQLGGTR